jgi:transcriptional regulator with XRE-family HTH domain
MVATAGLDLDRQPAPGPPARPRGASQPADGAEPLSWGRRTGATGRRAVSARTRPTSGTQLLDALIDDVQVGDNLVIAGDGDAPLDLLADRFVTAARGRVPLVMVRVASPWRGPVPDGVMVLDWSAVLSGRPVKRSGALEPGATLPQALASLRAADEAVGTGAAFVFDRLDAVQAAWSDAEAMELFLSTCPRLYRRRSLALWPIELSARRPTFLRRLTEVNQVVGEMVADQAVDTRERGVEVDPVTSADPAFVLTVRKADGRASEVVGRSRRVTVADGDLLALGPATSTRQRLGTMLREQRLARGLAQAELARRVGITASALSQMERGVRGPGGDTLVRLWEVLGVPFGPPAGDDAGYVVARRSGRERRTLQDGLVGERLLDDPTTGQVWRVEVAPGAQGDRGPFPVKAPESLTVVRGVLDVTLGGRIETLHEGDALLSTRAAIGGWCNPGSTPAEVLWYLHATPRPDVPR